MPFQLRWPTQFGHITQPFGVNWTGVPDFYRRFGLPGHEGLDFEAPHGSEIYACASGVISRIAPDGDSKPYGNQIRITHLTDEGEFETTYAHLDRVRDDLREGMLVRAGDLLGYADSSGNSRGAHLHLTLKKKGASARGETYFPRDIMDPTPFLLPFGAEIEAEIPTEAGTPAPEPVPTAELPVEAEAAAAVRLSPPPVPQAYNQRYRLQADETQYRRAWSWAANIQGARHLNLIAAANAPYSNARRRSAQPSTRYVDEAIAYLNPAMPPNGTPRFWASGGNFFCNIFVNDCTRLLHCEIPNNPANTSVSQMLNWLQTEGLRHGWQPAANGFVAQQHVNDGHVAVMLWSNRIRNDHSAIVRPGEGRTVNGFYYPRVAQAGATITPDADSHQTFGRGRLARERFFFFIHE